MTEQERDYFFDLQGYLVLKNALSVDQVNWINKWIDRQSPSQPGDWLGHVHVHSYQGHDGTNYQNIVEGGSVFEDLIDHAAWIEDIRRWVCNDFNGISINECFLNIREKGGFIGIHSGGHVPAYPMVTRHHTGRWLVGQINVLMALTNIGPGDGATVLVPGSHKCHVKHPLLAEGKNEIHRDTEPASGAAGMREMHLKAGDVLMFTDGVTHGSSERTNNGQRRILIYRYSPHTMATRYNYIPSDELLARLTPTRRAMIQPVTPRLAPGRTLRAPEPRALTVL